MCEFVHAARTEVQRWCVRPGHHATATPRTCPPFGPSVQPTDASCLRTHRCPAFSVPQEPIGRRVARLLRLPVTVWEMRVRTSVVIHVIPPERRFRGGTGRWVPVHEVLACIRGVTETRGVTKNAVGVSTRRAGVFWERDWMADDANSPLQPELRTILRCPGAPASRVSVHGQT